MSHGWLYHCKCQQSIFHTCRDFQGLILGFFCQRFNHSHHGPAHALEQLFVTDLRALYTCLRICCSEKAQAGSYSYALDKNGTNVILSSIIFLLGGSPSL